MQQNESLCNEVEIVKEFAYLGEIVSTYIGYQAAASASARFTWLNIKNVLSNAI